MIIAQGGRFGGWALFAKEGRAKFVYNMLGIQEFADRGGRRRSRRHPPGPRSSSPTTAAGSPRAATSPCTTTARRSARGRVEATQPLIFSADETTDIGYESGITVSADYAAARSRFNGKIHWVQLDVGNDDNDHFIDPEERLRVAMARQ